jgi:hypothetical protein
LKMYIEQVGRNTKPISWQGCGYVFEELQPSSIVRPFSVLGF